MAASIISENQRKRKSENIVAVSNRNEACISGSNGSNNGIKRRAAKRRHGVKRKWRHQYA